MVKQVIMHLFNASMVGASMAMLGAPLWATIGFSLVIFNVWMARVR